jgi:outer membrane protein assembly factor BamB
MKSCRQLALLGVLVLVALDAAAANWPSWRGPNDDGTTSESKFAVEWNKDENVRWRVDLPNRGNSSPIVWQNRVFVTQAIEQDGRREVMCFNRDDGRLLWKSGTTYTNAETTHETNPHCSASPVTDGERVIASFASAGVFCFDLNGKEVWRADLGPQTHIWGQGSSPVIHGDLCFVYHGPGKPSVLYALDKKSGKTVWQLAIPEVQLKERFDGFAGKTNAEVGSFASPLVIRTVDRDELILSRVGAVQSLDPATGRQLWTCDGMNPLIYASPTYGQGILVAMGGFFGSTLFIKPGGSGDVTQTHRIWYEQRARKHRIGSPIVKDGYIYLSNTIGVAECIELATGKTVWEERLKATGPSGETWSSMVLAGDKLYVVNQSGDTLVLRAAPKYELIATNPVGEISNSTLALSQGDIFLRTHKALWCISAPKTVAAAKQAGLTSSSSR